MGYERNFTKGIRPRDKEYTAKTQNSSKYNIHLEMLTPNSLAQLLGEGTKDMASNTKDYYGLTMTRERLRRAEQLES